MASSPATVGFSVPPHLYIILQKKGKRKINFPPKPYANPLCARAGHITEDFPPARIKKVPPLAPHAVLENPSLHSTVAAEKARSNKWHGRGVEEREIGTGCSLKAPRENPPIMQCAGPLWSGPQFRGLLSLSTSAHFNFSLN